MAGSDELEGARSGTAGPSVFLTTHARVLMCVAADPDNRIRDIAACAGVTERHAQLILAALENGGYLTRRRIGRRNAYIVDPALVLPPPDDSGPTVGDLITLFTPHRHRRRPGTTRSEPQM